MELPLEEILKLQRSLESNADSKKSRHKAKIQIVGRQSENPTNKLAKADRKIGFQARTVKEPPKKFTSELLTKEIKMLKKELKKKGPNHDKIFITYQKLTSKLNLMTVKDKQSSG